MQKQGNQSPAIDPAAAERKRAERLNRFAPPAEDAQAAAIESAAPPTVGPVDGTRSGRVVSAVGQVSGWLKLRSAGSAGLRAASDSHLASASDLILKTAIRERPVTRAFRVVRSHPWLAAVSAVCVVIAGLMASLPATNSELDSLSDEPITDVTEYATHEFDDASEGDPESLVVPVRTAAAFIDSGFVAGRSDDAGTVRTVPFETYDSQPQNVEHAGFDSARVSANRGAWLTGTIETATDSPRARFTE